MRSGRTNPFRGLTLFIGFTLDNFDELERVSKDMAALITGRVSPLTQSLQETYASLGIPRHPKKGVARQPVAEVQGAIVDGRVGLAYPKPEKVLRYLRLAQLLLIAGEGQPKTTPSGRRRFCVHSYVPAAPFGRAEPYLAVYRRLRRTPTLAEI